MSEYIASTKDLGFSFRYPLEYEESIAWQEQDVEAGGDGLQLGFLQRNEIVGWLTTAKGASRRPLVPFARGGDNDDGLWCFDASDSAKVFVINLGDKKRRAFEWASSGYLGMVCKTGPSLA